MRLVMASAIMTWILSGKEGSLFNSCHMPAAVRVNVAKGAGRELLLGCSIPFATLCPFDAKPHSFALEIGRGKLLLEIWSGALVTVLGIAVS